MGAKGWESLDVVLGSGVEYEIRTTVHPGSPAAEHLPGIVGELRRRGVTHFALQEARPRGATAEFAAAARAWDVAAWEREFTRLTRVVAEAGFTWTDIRRA